MPIEDQESPATENQLGEEGKGFPGEDFKKAMEIVQSMGRGVRGAPAAPIPPPDSGSLAYEQYEDALVFYLAQERTRYLSLCESHRQLRQKLENKKEEVNRLCEASRLLQSTQRALGTAGRVNYQLREEVRALRLTLLDKGYSATGRKLGKRQLAARRKDVDLQLIEKINPRKSDAKQS